VRQEKVTGPAALVLTATAARRYYFDDASKSDIAAELGVSRFKVARLLDQARASGLVRIELDYRGEIDLELSVRLSSAYGRGTASSSTAPPTTTTFCGPTSAVQRPACSPRSSPARTCSDSPGPALS